MEHPDYPSNSRASTAAKKVEKVVESGAIRRKTPLSKRFVNLFVGGDVKSVADYVLAEVLVPAIKDMLVEAASQSVDKIIFGETRSSSSRSRRSSNGYVNYGRYSQQDPRKAYQTEPRAISRRARSRHDFDEIVIPTRAEAEEVIDRLHDLIGGYQVATVADLYELVGITASHADDKWGWNSIGGSSITRIREGYLLNLPDPEPID